MALINSLLKEKIPNKTEIWFVFSTITFSVFSWSIWKFIYQIPSDLLNTRWGDIVWNLQALMAAALLESILVSLGMVFLSFILPVKWFRDGFRYKGFVTLLIMIGVVTWSRKVFVYDDYFPAIDILYKGGIIFFTTWVALLITIHIVKPIQKIVAFIEKRVEVFSYLYIPLGFIGLIALLIKSVAP